MLCVLRVIFRPVLVFPNINQDRVAPIDLLPGFGRRNLRYLFLCLGDQSLKTIHVAASDYGRKGSTDPAGDDFSSIGIAASGNLWTPMKISVARILFLLVVVELFGSRPAPAKDLGWQPPKTWVFVVGVLSWKHSEMFGSFPVKNRRDDALVDFFKKSGVPDSRIVYLRDKEATQARIDTEFSG